MFFNLAVFDRHKSVLENSATYDTYSLTDHTVSLTWNPCCVKTRFLRP
jgi:hypothetical protein